MSASLEFGSEGIKHATDSIGFQIRVHDRYPWIRHQTITVDATCYTGTQKSTPCFRSVLRHLLPPESHASRSATVEACDSSKPHLDGTTALDPTERPPAHWVEELYC